MACVECFTGAVHHNEKPTGQITTVHGRRTYVAHPPGGAATAKGIIVIIPDAFGLPFINNQILADNYAAKGQFTVYLPDFMDGACAPLWMINTFSRVFAMDTAWDWVTKPYHIFWTLYGFLPFAIQNRFGVAMPKVNAFVTAVRQNEGKQLPIGAAGFCWGAPFTVNLAYGAEIDGKPLSDANFIAHPSNMSVPGDFKDVRKPLAVGIGDNDKIMPMNQVREMEAALRSIPGLKSEVVIYDGAGHGFAVRADPGNEKQSAQAKEAEDQAVKFFTQCFSEVVW